MLKNIKIILCSYIIVKVYNPILYGNLSLNKIVKNNNINIFELNFC